MHNKRYQKSPVLSCLAKRLPKWLGLCLALSYTLAGCATEKAKLAVNGKPAQASVAQTPGSKPGINPVLQAMPARNPQAEQALEEARKAMQGKQWARLAQLVPQAAPEPLVGIYAEYWDLRQQIQDRTSPLPLEGINGFLQRNPQTYLADRLKADWVVAAALQNDFATVLQVGPIRHNNINVDCASLLAANKLEGRAVSAEEAMQTFKPATLCWTMLTTFYKQGIVGRDDLTRQLRATLETAKTAQARRLAGILYTPKQLVAYDALIKSPRKWLSAQAQPADAASTELLALALSRLARESNRPAAASWVEQNWANALPAQDLEWVWGQFGLVSALNTEPEAVRWYRRSGQQGKTDYNHAWEVRSELLQLPIEWSRVEAAIRKMSARQQAEPVWVYWLARALEGQGNTDGARQLYASIQNEFNFYGQLANDELGQALALPALPQDLTQAELAQARGNPGLQRGVRLFDLGWRPEAVAEWNFALRGMNDRQLLAAAEFAREEAIFDRVINTSLLTQNEVHFPQRFIAPFEGRVSAKAREIQLDPSWVYGLIRQESRFITDARSRVGASGLMQLMPATAKWVANKIGMKDFKLASVNDFDTNTLLGTQYLSIVLQQLGGSEVLATAGYNAGPGRPIKWRARLKGPVEGAIFAETIPFTETRLYVKNVLSNAVYYSMLFNNGQPQSLKARLGTIVPAGQTRVALP